MKIKWKPAMTVGNKILDNQHKRLVNAVNDLIRAAKQKEGLPAVRRVLGFLKAHVAKHFDYEEEYMLKHKYPGLKEHKKVHEEFTQFFEQFRTEFIAVCLSDMLTFAKSNELVDKAKKFLGDFMIDHFLTEDHDYYLYISKKK